MSDLGKRKKYTFCGMSDPDPCRICRKLIRGSRAQRRKILDRQYPYEAAKRKKLAGKKKSRFKRGTRRGHPIRVRWDLASIYTDTSAYIIRATKGKPMGEDCRCCAAKPEEEKAKCHCREDRPERNLLAEAGKALARKKEDEAVRILFENIFGKDVSNDQPRADSDTTEA